MDNSKLYKNLCDFRERTYRIFVNSKDKANSSITDASTHDEHYLNLISSLGKSNLATIADVAKISRPAATKVIKKFLQKGYVTKTLNSEDNREYFIELSPCACKYMQESEVLFAQILDEKLSVLTDTEIQELSRIMQKLIDDNQWQ